MTSSFTPATCSSVYGSPWQPKFRIWAFGAMRGAELASKWAKIPDRHVGCADLLARVREVQPKLHVFGHIHQDRGLWSEGATTFANVTTDEGASPPMVLDLRLV